VRHQWSLKDRPDPYQTRQYCTRPGCGILKITRHEDGRHWAEYFRDSMQVHVGLGHTPPCVGEQSQ
jgi:hypothetical protein